MAGVGDTDFERISHGDFPVVDAAFGLKLTDFALLRAV